MATFISIQAVEPFSLAAEWELPNLCCFEHEEKKIQEGVHLLHPCHVKGFF